MPLKGKTDWARIDRMPPSEVEATAAADTDGAPISDEDWAKAEIGQPRKVAAGLKLDHDLLD